MGSSSYNRYDKSGHRTGTSKRDLLGGGYTRYDSKGRKTGSSNRQVFGGGYTHYDTKGNKLAPVMKVVILPPAFMVHMIALRY